MSCCVSCLSLLMADIKNRKTLQLIQTIWDVMLYSQYFTFHWKLLVLVSRIQKSPTRDNNFGKWKGTFRSDRPKWPDRSLWTTFKAAPEYSGRTKPKWSVPIRQLWVHMFPWKKWVLMIYEINHIWTAEMNPQLTCSQRQWLYSSVGRASHR